MMKLTLQGISERTQWEEKGYQLPQYDINKMKKGNKRGTILDSFWSWKSVSCFSCGCGTESVKCRSS